MQERDVAEDRSPNVWEFGRKVNLEVACPLVLLNGYLGVSVSDGRGDDARQRYCDRCQKGEDGLWRRGERLKNQFRNPSRNASRPKLGGRSSDSQCAEFRGRLAMRNMNRRRQTCSNEERQNVCDHPMTISIDNDATMKKIRLFR